MATEIGMPRFGTKQLAQWLYEKNVSSIDEMTNISKAVRERLKERYEVGVHEPIERMTSVDGTEKYLFPTLSGHFIETVYIPDGERYALRFHTSGMQDELPLLPNGKTRLSGKSGNCRHLESGELGTSRERTH